MDNVCLQKGTGLLFVPAQVLGIVAEHRLIDLIFGVTAFFFGDQEVGVHELIDMVRNGGLSQSEHAYDGGALHPVFLFFDGLHNFNTVGVAKSFGYFFNLFKIERCSHISKNIDFILFSPRLWPRKPETGRPGCYFQQANRIK